MRLFFEFKILVFLLFTAFSGGCSTASTVSRELSEMKYPPNPEAQNTVQINESRSVKKEGWQLPKAEKQKQVRKTVIDSYLENGDKIKVTTTDYAPIKDFFTEEPFASLGKNQAFRLTKINLIRESKVNGKIFCYTIFAKATKPNEKTGKPIAVGSDFIYQYVDRDGDGKFETLVTDGSVYPVPSWVTQ